MTRHVFLHKTTMKNTAAALLLIILAELIPSCTSFQSVRWIYSPPCTKLYAEGSFRQSRLAGNQREPTAEELKIMDEMIVKLSNAKPYELPSSVQRAFRVISSPRFFVRIAELADAAKDATEQARLIALADNLVSTLDAVVSTAQDKMQEYAKDVETVVAAAAEPDSGEFMVPLLPERLQSMRQALNQLDSSSLDGDTFLSTVDAWMNKSHQDGLDLMVGILQIVLQMYAGRRILEARSATASQRTSAGELFDELLQTDSDLWDAAIRQGLSVADTTAEDLIQEIQRNMESIILSLESGSMAQRVQAEYLQELVKRIETVQKAM